MFRKPFCMLLCLALAFCALPAPAQAENAAQLYDFNGDGQVEELRCAVADTVLTLQVGAVSAEVALNDFSDTYILAIADLDASDAFMEIAALSGRFGATMAAAFIRLPWSPMRARRTGSRSTAMPATACAP